MYATPGFAIHAMRGFARLRSAALPVHAKNGFAMLSTKLLTCAQTGPYHSVIPAETGIQTPLEAAD